MLALSPAELAALLYADVPYGDLTSHNLGLGAKPGAITFAARDPMCCCAVEEAAAILELAGVRVERHAASGDWLQPGDAILSGLGPAAALFAGWKCAQTLIESCSGIATVAAAMVDAANGIAVGCTRKHFPGNKALAAKAVVAGGAIMHRLGLSESLLLTAEHRVFMNAQQLADTVQQMRRRQPEKPLVVEVETVREALALLELGVEFLQLEKLSPTEVAEVVAAARHYHCRVAVAGGVNLATIAGYAAVNPDLLVTSAPFFAPPRDVQVRFSAMA
ncbi:MAG: ModD protein [Gammaproteobacteria bacterium]|nr:ModD protein [Gammaproteobacteria bacterium]